MYTFTELGVFNSYYFLLMAVHLYRTRGSRGSQLRTKWLETFADQEVVDTQLLLLREVIHSINLLSEVWGFVRLDKGKYKPRIIFVSNTAVFGKVYRTIFQRKKRRFVFKTRVIMYIQKDTLKNYSKIL